MNVDGSAGSGTAGSSAAGAGGSGGSSGAGGSGGAGLTGGTGGGACDPAKPFAKPAPLATTPRPINTGAQEAWPRISRDAKKLYFVRGSGRDGGRILNGDIVHVSRSHPDESFDEATTASAQFTLTLNNDAPFLSPNELRLYFSNGLDHIYFSEIPSVGGAFPYPGQQVDFTSTGIRDFHPYLVGDSVLYFSSSRGGNVNELKLHSSTRTTTNKFGEPRPLNIQTTMPGQQSAPVVSSDERVVFFSNDGTIYRAIRGAGGSFGVATPADDLNGGNSYPGSLSADDCVLYLHSDRLGGTDFDIWFTRATTTIDGG